MEWSGNRESKGYGRITGGPNRGKKAHRVIWEEANGPVPDGLFVLHHCDNPPCVNLEHLYLGTVKDNARDRKERERGVRGERVNTNKLTESQVQEIRWLKGRGESSRDVAAIYGITQAMACLIWRQETWEWLSWKPQIPSTRTQAQIHEHGLRRRREGRERGAKKRSATLRGKGNPAAKLTESQVYGIRRRFDQGEVQERIAEDYAIRQTGVSSIGRRISWSHLPEK